MPVLEAEAEAVSEMPFSLVQVQCGDLADRDDGQFVQQLED